MTSSQERYQVIINGKAKTVAELTPAECRRELVKAMRVIEEMDNRVQGVACLIKAWRK